MLENSLGWFDINAITLYGISARYVIVLIIMSVKSVLTLVKSLGRLRLLVGFIGPI